MSAGTITLTNGSAIVGGTGTSFTTELAAGDFIVSTVGGVPYTLPVKTVNSNTQLTLVSSYTGPTQAGAAWYAVPRVAMNLVTAALVAQSAEALRGLNYDKDNWLQVFSATTEDITVRLPGGQTFNGPSWKYITDLLKNRDAVNTSWSVINGDTALPGNNTEIRGGAIRSVYQVAGADHMSVEVRAQGTVGGVYTPVIEMVSPSGGAPVTRTWSLPPVASELVGRDSIGTSGAKIPLLSKTNTWSAIQDFNDRISQWTIPPASSSTGDYVNAHGLRVGLRGRGGNGDPVGGYASFYYQDNVNVKVSAIINLNAYMHDLNWRFEDSGNAISPGSWITNSDGRLKTNKERIQNPLSLMKELGGYTWTRLDGGAWGIGFIAQEVAKIFPEAVVEAGDRTLDDGTVVKGVLSPDTYGVAAALHHEAILALLARIEVLEAKLKDK
ncbi:tail fiber domain-containing protein [Enterobacter roggenkampii]|uniref:tail fiber domain-containing protein n=1 Tax=Enterobacter roggenkampii TaxID=1812935 RepID=UPI00388EE6FE